MKLKKKTMRTVFFAALIAAIILAVFICYQLSAPQGAKIYLIKNGNLSYVLRPEASGAIDRISEQLLAGPDDAEKQNGYFTEIPKGTKIIESKIIGAEIQLTFNRELEKYGGGSAKIKALISQIVYTFTETKGIKKVKIKIQGREDVVLGGEGFIIDKAISREDLKN